MRICVIGGMNLDVTGSVGSTFTPRDSNPGSVRLSAGGVGRNIACQLARAGCEALLITCLTNDLAGEMLLRSCRETGVDTFPSFPVDGPASSYMALHGPDGDLLAAVNDMECMERLTPELLEKRLELINACDACVIDANLRQDAVAFLAERVRAPLIADAVSAHKCARLKPAMKRLAALKPNALEARALTGEADPLAQARKLLDLGVGRAIISLGARGVLAADESGAAFLAPERVFRCQTNGAGDALTAGIAVGAARGQSAADCARLGMRLARDLLSARETAPSAQ